ncbi:MAG: lanthionine synthetase C family protein [bacterium]|nr:lanthionine synthetase C family protein [bacterium]
MKWKPIIEPPASGAVLKKLSQIAGALMEHSRDSAGPKGLMDGTCGIALFFFYYSRLTGEEKYSDCAAELFGHIFESINDGFSDFRFSSGLAGIGWTLRHLVQSNLIDIDVDELLDELEPFFNRAVNERFSDNDYDYLHGALGVGMYWLGRLPHPGGQTPLCRCIDFLAVILPTLLNPEARPKGVNLGVAHGIPSVIAFLSRALEVGVSNTKIPGLLNSVVEYLLGRMLDPGQFNCFFPDSVRVDRPLTGSRLGWCYGDPGIGSIVWRAAQVTGNVRWRQKAMEVLLHSTTRNEPGENLVKDACFCHGAAGLVHIYNRIYQSTGMEAFKESARFWLDHTLATAVHKNAAAGFKVWCGENLWQDRFCVLDGIAGMGLALMASVSETEPTWDRCFLLS